jgi:hypothetical protein
MIQKNNSNIRKLFDDIKNDCKKYNVRLKLVEEKYIKLSDNLKVGGYFDAGDTKQRPVLACAMGNKFATSILIHESCHLDQWAKKTDIWKKIDGIELIDEWLSGKEIDEKKLNNIFKKVIELELDCEKRSVEKIKRYGIPLDIEKYKQRANAYILFYNYVKKHRKWSIPGNPPYGDKILSYSPKRWLKNYNKIPKKLEEAYDKYLNLL